MSNLQISYDETGAQTILERPARVRRNVAVRLMNRRLTGAARAIRMVNRLARTLTF